MKLFFIVCGIIFSCLNVQAQKSSTYECHLSLVTIHYSNSNKQPEAEAFEGSEPLIVESTSPESCYQTAIENVIGISPLFHFDDSNTVIGVHWQYLSDEMEDGFVSPAADPSFYQTGFKAIMSFQL